MLNLKKDWKESESILVKLRQEAKKINPQRLLIIDIAFNLVMISFFVLLNSVFIRKIDNFNLMEKVFFASLACFNILFFIMMYILTIVKIRKSKILKK